MSQLRLRFNNGHVSSRSSAELQEGELQQTTGIWYKPGDTQRAHKISGRTLFGDTGATGELRGIRLCLFDSGGTDYLVALDSQGVLYGATPGVTGSWSSISNPGGLRELGSLTSAPYILSAAQSLDRWYFADGTNRPRVLENDGSVRYAGMIAPDEAPETTVSAVSATVSRPAEPTDSDGFSNLDNTMDADKSTFGHASLSSADSAYAVWTGWSSESATTDRRLYLKYAVAGRQITGYGEMPLRPEREDNVQEDAGFKVTVKIEYKEDGGSYSTLDTITLTSAQEAGTFQYPVTDAVDRDTVFLKVTMTYVSGTSQATLRVYDVRISDGGEAANFTTDSGLGYAFTEYDSTRGLESPPSPLTTDVLLSSQNTVTLTLPSSAKNSNATRWNIYRHPDGGTVEELGLIGWAEIGDTEYVDDFEKYAYDEQPQPIIPLLGIEAGGVITYIPRDTPPNKLEHITSFKGALVGTNGRSLYTSLAGRPESWAEVSTIEKFMTDTRDELIACQPLQEMLICGTVDSMFTMSDVVRVEGGRLALPEVRPISGQPGVVSRRGITAISVTGESLAAWVSPFGIHLTNGRTADRITDDVDWTNELSQSSLSSCVLHWDKQRHVLLFAYDSDGGGSNDRYALIHMAPEHRKQNGQPKITWGHYGKISDVCDGLVSGVHRVYSSESGDTNVYLEWNGTTDASQAYSGTIVPMIVKTGRNYSGWREFSLDRGNLHHTDAGSGQTVSVQVDAATDDPKVTQAITNTVAVDGNRGTGFYIGRAGESAEITITHTGSADFALRELWLEGEVFSDAGKVL